MCSSCQTIVTLTSEINKVMGALYKLEPDGNVKLHTGLSIARVSLSTLTSAILVILIVLPVDVEASSKQESKNACHSIYCQSCRQ